jgi:beta-glucosidase
MGIPVKAAQATFDIDEVIREASTSEKVSLLSDTALNYTYDGWIDKFRLWLMTGYDSWHTVPLHRFNVPSVRVSDGPNGVRGTKFFNGVPAACLPCGTGLASTWDLHLLNKAVS